MRANPQLRICERCTAEFVAAKGSKRRECDACIARRRKPQCRKGATA